MIKENVFLAYRGFCAEYIKDKDEWRIFRKEKWNDTIAYYDGKETLEDIMTDIDFRLDERW